MTSLRDIFENHQGRLIHKFSHYFDIYERYFSKYRGTDVVILEIGISHGGSLQMWRKYFGEQARIYAVDINPDCKKLEETNVKIFIGSQEDRNFLEKLAGEIPTPDIIIDDGGHTMRQQITTFEVLYPYLKSNGIYLCEDTCTSYWYEYGGRRGKKDTFVEYSKRLVDYLYAWHFKSKKVHINEFTTSTNSIHFYDSMVIFEKMPRTAPKDMQQGQKTVDHNEDPQAYRKTLFHKIIKKIDSLRS
ncbi:MAG TPA: class I SAM-dependent methyltransferase [Puia sp.]|nr:class I SAM-dependent methyltransferase [Puia sp.]